ncbi:hypothetical protein GUF72_08475 [Xanthomonas citri pv. citri]|nr:MULTISPECIES: hypothetical protein [Xanthomonas]OOW50915.1 hypothetical protein Xcnt_14185 [Xanthomonas campestris pv. centellae]AJD70749.1 hypothetical protein J151_04353 [Xanthomonas citri subsp. citri A306]AJY84235.1 hypothetical protein J159_04302 [Xanthomonas citri pv. citri]AJY88661.1 hypothetical protein J158_04306 [Xanthomonas citri subsp. citri UI6]AJY93129.1 hypothetical protein J169_04350 [Xanthomonas citri pv. citri]
MTPSAPSGAARSRQPSNSASPSLFDTAMQQLACRERQHEQAAQIARGAVSVAGLSGRAGCVADTPLQIEAMLRTAAARGDVDAQRYLLAQHAADLMQRAVAAAPAGTQPTLSPDAEREVAVIVSDLEALALAGHRDAIATLAQVVESPLLHAPDPVYAAAWRLAARQPPGQPLDATAPLQAEEEVLDALTQQQQQQARSLAVELFDDCCRHLRQLGDDSTASAHQSAHLSSPQER